MAPHKRATFRNFPRNRPYENCEFWLNTPHIFQYVYAFKFKFEPRRTARWFRGDNYVWSSARRFANYCADPFRRTIQFVSYIRCFDKALWIQNVLCSSFNVIHWKNIGFLCRFVVLSYMIDRKIFVLYVGSLLGFFRLSFFFIWIHKFLIPIQYSEKLISRYIKKNSL